MTQKAIDKPVRAILQFGPATSTSGFRAGEYYQAVIDPNMCSPSGDFIRFGAYSRDEIQGWQRVEAMTVAEVLGEDIDVDMDMDVSVRKGYTVEPGATVTMRHLEK